MHNELRFVSAVQAQIPLESIMGRMKELEYQVEFLTPAFLGNAEQDGQWRTPPFKALLRQWWRVVWAAENGYRQDLYQMRKAEAELFGSATDGDRRGSSKSQVRMRLDRWKEGRQDTREMTGSHGYLGFGPLSKDTNRDSRRKLQSEAAIGTEETAKLSLCVPAGSVEQFLTAISLIDAYGTSGGRSRNGWGSIKLVPEGDTPPLSNNLSRFLRPWQEALGLDWAHAIGSDSKGPLIWAMNNLRDWEKAMQDLAVTKREFLRYFKPRGSSPFPEPQERHWLSFPVTGQKVSAWNGTKRIPNSLRFKVRRDPQDPSRLQGIIFHMPCLPPGDFEPDKQEIAKVWRKTHEYLDGKLNRLTWNEV